MTAGRIIADGPRAQHQGAPRSRRAVIVAAVVVLGVAAAIGVPFLIAAGGPSAAVAPPAVAPPAAAPSVAAPAPTVAAPAPAIVPLIVPRATAPTRVPGRRMPLQPGFRTSWGRFVY